MCTKEGRRVAGWGGSSRHSGGWAGAGTLGGEHSGHGARSVLVVAPGLL
jgi:hypothetical protein